MRLTLILAHAALFCSSLITWASAPGEYQTVQSDTLQAVNISALATSYQMESAPVYQMERAQIEQTGRTELSDLLNLFPGVSLRDYGGWGGIKTLNVRSLGSAHTAVVYDGIDLGNMQNAQVDLGKINIDQVEQLRLELAGSDELFRSAFQQLSHGVLLLGSVAPQFLATDTRNYHLAAQMSAASFGTWSPSLHYEQKWSEKWSTRLSASYLFSQGDYPYWVENGGHSYQQTRLGASMWQADGALDIYGDLGPKAGKIQAKILYSQEDKGLPGPVILYTQNPTEQLATRDVQARVQWTQNYGAKWRVKAGGGYALSQTRYQDENPAYSETQVDHFAHQKITLDAVAAYQLNQHWDFSLAQDVYLAHLETDMPNSVCPSRLYALSAFSGKYTRGGLLVKATLGLHYLTERLDDKNSGTGGSLQGSTQLRFTPSLSASYRFNDAWMLRASYKNACRMPTFNDLYYARVGNRNLRPEQADQLNIGSHWMSSFGLDVSVDAYCHYVRDKIVAIPTLFVWKMYNLGRALSAGADLSLRYSHRFHPSVATALQAKYSYQYTADITDPHKKSYGLPLPYTPAHSAGATLSVLTRWVNLNYSFDALSERYAQAQPLESAKLSPYMVHSLSINRKFVFRYFQLHLSAALNNIGDESYELVKNYPMPGRNFKLSVRIVL